MNRPRLHAMVQRPVSIPSCVFELILQFINASDEPGKLCVCSHTLVCGPLCGTNLYAVRSSIPVDSDVLCVCPQAEL